MTTLADLLITLEADIEDARAAFRPLAEHLEHEGAVVESRVVGYYPSSGSAVVRVVVLVEGVDPDALDEHLEDLFAGRDEVAGYDQIGDYTEADEDAFERYVHDTSVEDLPAELRDEIDEEEEDD